MYFSDRVRFVSWTVIWRCIICLGCISLVKLLGGILTMMGLSYVPALLFIAGVTFSANWRQLRAVSKCYDEYGCLSTDGPWQKRLLNSLPMEPDRIQTKFLFLTRNKPQLYELEANAFSLRGSDFNPRRKTMIYIHGFLYNGKNKRVQDFVKAMMQHGDYNIISVDWEKGAVPPYTQATANTRLVGLQLAHLLKFLQTDGKLKLSDVHIVGHSLGAHIAGYAGKRLSGLGRISALDPAGPYFEGHDPVVRLDRADANFVDAIHTDAGHLVGVLVASGGLGMRTPIGHVDFYPNGGENQVGCRHDIIKSLKDLDLIGTVKNYFSCDHMRVINYFTESINLPDAYMGYSCPNYEMFQKGECLDCSRGECIRMGFHATKPRDSGTKVYLNTRGESPFAAHHYLVTVKVSQQMTVEKVRARVSIGFSSSQFSVPLHVVSDGFAILERGRRYKFVVTSGDKIENINRLDFNWYYNCDLKISNVFKCLGLGSRPELKLDHIEIMAAETRKTTKFCIASQKIGGSKTLSFFTHLHNKC